MAISLPSFSEGLPVKIRRLGRTVTVDRSMIHVRHEGAAAFTEKDRRISVSEFRAVELLRQTMRFEDVPGSSVVFSVRLLHSSDPGKTVTLASDQWESDEYAASDIRPLRRLWKEVGQVLGLPARVRGIS